MGVETSLVRFTEATDLECESFVFVFDKTFHKMLTVSKVNVHLTKPVFEAHIPVS